VHNRELATLKERNCEIEWLCKMNE